jgi:transposase
MATTPRHLTPEFKAQVVLELLTQARSAAEICRAHPLKDSLLYRSARICRWKQEFLERAPCAFAGSKPGETSRQAQRIAELERMVGRLTLELDVLKKASEWRTSR